ncbi:MAG: flagellar basal-body rod protein FlgF [Alphaproteobacteria bacterium]|nr:MAG: flagellar basal-body rod protein FlgF [Alphaproteobacteria bacterium]
MQSSLYVALAAQRVLQQQLTTVAHNVANMNTVGFRAESVNFDALVSMSEPDGVHFPMIAKTQPSAVPGTLERTGNPLDVALSGPGWFAIQTPGGVAYTRDGRMQIDAFGELRSVAGNHQMLDAAQAPILVNPNGGPIEISPDGRLRQDGNVIANIGVFEVAEPNLVARYENSAFLADVEGLPIAPGTATRLSQGFVETSNVDAIAQMANLISISRYFESLNASITESEKAMDRSIQELAPPQS